MNTRQQRMVVAEIADLILSFTDYNAKDWDNIPNTDKQSICEIRAKTILEKVKQYSV